jgi:hypothetical protein
MPEGCPVPAMDVAADSVGCFGVRIDRMHSRRPGTTRYHCAMKTRILLVEDDERLADLTAEYLRKNDSKS